MAEFEWKMCGRESHVTSSVSVSTYLFTWSIENFPKWELDTLLTSPNFYPESDQVFYASFQQKKIGGNYYFYLNFHQESGPNISIKHTISIKDCMDYIFWVKHDRHKYQSSTKNYEIEWLSSKIEDFSNAAKNKVLIFQCTMEFCKFKTERNLQKCHPNPVSPLDNLSALSEDLKAMYASSLHADVTLKVDDLAIRVHKTLLCARSPVFAKMFENGMDECKKNTVDIPDLQMPVLKDMVAFLYSGTLSSDDFDSIYALYYAADKYDVSSLRKTCVDVLLSKLDVANACSVLTLAERHSDFEFKGSVMDFIEFNFDKILSTEVWGKFVKDDTQLATEVIGIHSKKYKNINEIKSEN